jgi:SAM-dependent methyltransferase
LPYSDGSAAPEPADERDVSIMKLSPQTDPAELQRIYQRRFDAHVEYRTRVWRVLTTRFFARYVAPEATVLDLGCGYGQFINNISCARKYAMDLNPQAVQYLSPEVDFINQDCSQPWRLPDNSLDVVFTSNFFEHLPSKALLSDALVQAMRCLRPGGQIIALGPNVRYIGGAYWDFWDHHLALTEQSLAEILEIQGFRICHSIRRFLPYTMVNRRPLPVLFVSLYLMFRPAWQIMGKQFLVIAAKPTERG